MSIDWEVFSKGINVALLGLAGVFTVLILFYIVTKLLFHFGNKMDKDNSNPD
ncbi:OadG family protein [Acetivibrio mesophilus]|uniref:Oxaloacetate decarboxylase n=1 Tax=Acetivibrio mesophilus TaxID=2487273 RepID=A0A4Q0I890_9FIRM|nr:OadG family protein [Acetivibrio mesophilus]ODM25642.1 oxaloacetate decarboxylase [Clostridium sp. Bc-iso-3]RXE60227.1 oxaloacetate decarboxylase [Acetivibrio mesophilus]HHV29905.1 OadG family protein [Clostridium sp.]